MLKANTGSSINSNAHFAGKEAASTVKKGLGNVKLAFAYASCAYDLDNMLKGIAEELPGVPLIGNTSFTGVITPSGFVGGENGFIGMMALDDPDMTVGVASVTNAAGAFEAGMQVAKAAMEAAGKTTVPSYFHMVANPGEEEYYLKGITSVIGRVPFFGGSAADNSISGDWKLYTDKGVHANGVAVAFIYTDKAIVNQFTGAYRETADMGIITEVENDRTLISIDGTPAVQKYALWRGMSPDSLKGSALLVETICSPLGVKDRLGDLTAIRHPMNGNDDYSMAVGNKLAVGTAVIRMEATVEELITSTGHTLNTLKTRIPNPGAFHLVHCGGRRAGIGNRIDEVVSEVQRAAGNVPFIVEFTFGEYGFEADGINTCGGLMLSFTGFEE